MMKVLKYSQMLIVISLFGLSIFFSLYKLTESPSVWYDEGWYIQTSANWASSGVSGIQLSPGNIKHIAVLSVSYPLLYPLALCFKIFGTNILVARSLMATFIMAFLCAAYFLSRRLFGKNIALYVLALLATFPPLYANGKSVLGEVPGLLYLTLFLLCFLRAQSAIAARMVFWFIISGLFAGLSVTTKPVFLVLLPSILFGMYLGRGRNNITIKNIAIWGIGLFAPILIWFFVQFSGDVSPLQVLTFYANPYDLNDIMKVVLQNLKKLFSDTGPLYLVFLLIVWSISFIARRRTMKVVSIEEIIAFIFSILIAMAYLRTAGLYRYLFYAQGIALVFFPSSLIAASNFILKRQKAWFTFYAPRAVIILLFVTNLYQLMFNSWVANYYNSHKTAFWEEYFTHIPESKSVFFYDTPELVPFINHRNYYQSLRTPAADPIGTEQLSFIRSGNVDIIVTTDAIFDGDKNDLFSKYVIKEKAYKYSILIKIH